jgi:hypothetical protein
MAGHHVGVRARTVIQDPATVDGSRGNGPSVPNSGYRFASGAGRAPPQMNTTDTSERSGSDLVVVATGYLLFGLAVGFGVTRCAMAPTGTPQKADSNTQYTMIRLNDASVAVMRNDTGLVNFFLRTADGKMKIIRNPTDEYINRILENMDASQAGMTEPTNDEQIRELAKRFGAKDK